MDQTLAKILNRAPKGFFAPLQRLEGVVETLCKSKVLMTMVMERYEGMLDKHSYYYSIHAPFPKHPVEDELILYLSRLLKDQIVMTVMNKLIRHPLLKSLQIKKD